MKPKGAHKFVKGQVWKTKFAAVEIVGVGRQLLHYRVSHRHGRKRVSAQLSGIDAMAKYLATNEARLADSASAN